MLTMEGTGCDQVIVKVRLTAIQRDSPNRGLVLLNLARIRAALGALDSGHSGRNNRCPARDVLPNRQDGHDKRIASGDSQTKVVLARVRATPLGEG